ncbi:MAG: hypothetical protein ACPGUV_07615 [Polyangiales bacterium]
MRHRGTGKAGASSISADAGTASQPAAPRVASLARLDRDPFEPFAQLLRDKRQPAPQRSVIMPTTEIDEMRLVAVVQGAGRSRGMVVDRSSVGYVVQRGDFIGRAEYIRSAGGDGVAVALNWRIERILPSEVVLVREDPQGEGRPQRRVLALRAKSAQSTPTATDDAASTDNAAGPAAGLGGARQDN